MSLGSAGSCDGHPLAVTGGFKLNDASCLAALSALAFFHHSRSSMFFVSLVFLFFLLLFLDGLVSFLDNELVAGSENLDIRECRNDYFPPDSVRARHQSHRLRSSAVY